MIVIPFKTDSAIDYRPWGTVLLIAANVSVAYFLGFPVEMVPDMWGELPEEPRVNSWMLEYGEFRPLTWLTSVFVHADYAHLIGNMIFLWIFGLVVEGYVGWTRFLPLYLAIGAGQCAIEQVRPDDQRRQKQHQHRDAPVEREPGDAALAIVPPGRHGVTASGLAPAIVRVSSEVSCAARPRPRSRCFKLSAIM